MRAAVLNHPGDRLEIHDVERDAPGPTEIAFAVAGCGVCHTDLHVLKGEVAFPTPCVLGHETSGTVIDVGRDVRHLSVGDPVVCSFVMPCGTCRHCVRGSSDLCETFFAHNRLKGHLYDGTTRLHEGGEPVAMYSMAGFAAEAVVPATAAFRLDSDIDLGSAAILGCSFLTAYGAVANVARVTPGEDVAVIAAGGVGLNVITLAAVFGAARVIAVDVDDAKLAKATELGATHIVNSGVHDAVDAIGEITGGRGADVAFEALGRPETFELAVAAVGDGGRAVMIGISPVGQTASLDITRLVRRKIQVLGSYGGRPGTDMPRILDLAARRVIDPAGMISRTYALDDVAEAFDDLDAGAIVGRALVRP
ncbi:MAG: zinc-binding dehydrogenase [Actinobacteria bacterium]|nr:zinc-binding dehydrogenase [Actinomycetota bacterium]